MQITNSAISLNVDDVTASATSIETESWGERFFQVTDPNGVVIQKALEHNYVTFELAPEV